MLEKVQNAKLIKYSRLNVFYIQKINNIQFEID